MFFRVRAIYNGDLRIVAESGGRQLAAFKREHLAPGELEHVTLPKVLLEKADGPITISVREEARA